jgi:hypothetical protein
MHALVDAIALCLTLAFLHEAQRAVMSLGSKADNGGLRGRLLPTRRVELLASLRQPAEALVLEPPSPLPRLVKRALRDGQSGRAFQRAAAVDREHLSVARRRAEASRSIGAARCCSCGANSTRGSSGTAAR